VVAAAAAQREVISYRDSSLYLVTQRLSSCDAVAINALNVPTVSRRGFVPLCYDDYAFTGATFVDLWPWGHFERNFSPLGTELKSPVFYTEGLGELSPQNLQFPRKVAALLISRNITKLAFLLRLLQETVDAVCSHITRMKFPMSSHFQSHAVRSMLHLNLDVDCLAFNGCTCYSSSTLQHTEIVMTCVKLFGLAAIVALHYFDSVQICYTDNWTECKTFAVLRWWKPPEPTMVFLS
jgi:hypothetical protein